MHGTTVQADEEGGFSQVEAFPLPQVKALVDRAGLSFAGVGLVGGGVFGVLLEVEDRPQAYPTAGSIGYHGAESLEEELSDSLAGGAVYPSDFE